jgi:dolichol-phosphate mannosyltransferase
MSKLRTFEIIYIDDCSSDGSLEELSSLKDIKIIHMNKNYGQATALDAGFKATEGKIVVSLNGDG